MSYTILKTDLPLRDESLRYEDLGPGLYHDEIVVELDTGEVIAVSAERHWLENGAGISFHGYARWIEDDGQTRLAPTGAHIEASYPHTANPEALLEHGADDIATDVARLMLGEPTKLVREDGRPLIDVSEEVKLNASIRHQLKAVEATRSTFIGLE